MEAKPMSGFAKAVFASERQMQPGNTSAALWLHSIGVVLILFGVAIFTWMVPSLARTV
jgi:hypothetical protein